MDRYAVALTVSTVLFIASVINATIRCKTSREELRDRAEARRRMRYEGRDL